MALESVKPVTGGFCLPFDEMNRAGSLLAQARGIAACVGIAASQNEVLPEHAAANACWAIQELLDQVEKITSMKHSEAAK